MSTAAPGLTSTTAPGKVFASRQELADHYKSEWHKYNLKRREAGLALLEKSEFQARWEAALALRQEKEKNSAVSGTDHLKDGKKLTKKQQLKKEKKEQLKLQKQQKAEQATPATSASNDATMEDAKEENGEDGASSKTPVHHVPAALAASQENPEIDPLQSLFDAHRSETLQENVDYMRRKYGFFIPDQECLVDLEGLLGYCHEKIKLGHYCLYCEKVFPTWQGCQQHMINKQHTKLRYEPGFWEELDPFYDFRREDTSFMSQQEKEDTADAAAMETDETDNKNTPIEDDGDEDGWEDMSEDGNGDENEEAIYDGFEREIARFGLDVTPLGELVFPDGRVVGHRALRRYYKQNLRTEAARNTAVIAAQEAAGERIYGGQVININQYNMKREDVQGTGKGILVPVKQDGGGPAGFSTLSLYRYRAAVRKQRRGDEKGKRIREKTSQNINRMDKKHNRLMNGVSVAHAAR